MSSLVSLGDYISTQKGYAFKSKWYTKEGHPIVKVSDFTSDSIDPSKLVLIPNNIALEYSRYALHTNDVIVQTVGSWPSNPASVVGKAVHVPKNVHGALLNQNAVKIIPNEKIDNGFLFYLLRSDQFKDYIVGTAQGAASQASITLDSIKAFSFDIPPMVIQEGISAILSTYDDLIENNNRRISILEEMAQKLYSEWFIKFRFPGHEDVKMLDSELGEIPEGWEVENFGALVEYLRESIPKGTLDEAIAYMGLEHMPRKSISLSNWNMETEIGSTKLKFQIGDILFGKIRPYFHKVGVAQIDGVCSSDTFVLRPKTNYYTISVCIASSDDFVANAVQTSQGTKMPRANWDVLKEYKVPLATIDILNKFDDIVKAMIDSINNLSAKNRNLKKQRELLLPKLISGKLNISEMENI